MADPYQPVRWTKFVNVEGQPEPVPIQWLDSPEAKVAHSLRLPSPVPMTQAFNFWSARLKSLVPGTPSVSGQYFLHLCDTEAGQWVVRTVADVEGLYFARPQGPPTSDAMADPYGPEMPWIQRTFLTRSDNVHDNGLMFVQPPLYNYRFVEQPGRDVGWQASIHQPYVRIFGFEQEQTRYPDGKLSWIYRTKTPMQVMGIDAPSAKYGYTWRGIRRADDRAHGIAGGELLIYELASREVVAVRREFLFAQRNPRGPGAAMWEVAARCPSKGGERVSGGEFSQFAFDVLKTIEFSTTRK